MGSLQSIGTPHHDHAAARTLANTLLKCFSAIVKITIRKQQLIIQSEDFIHFISLTDWPPTADDAAVQACRPLNYHCNIRW